MNYTSQLQKSLDRLRKGHGIEIAYHGTNFAVVTKPNIDNILHAIGIWIADAYKGEVKGNPVLIIDEIVGDIKSYDGRWYFPAKVDIIYMWIAFYTNDGRWTKIQFTLSPIQLF